MADVPAEKQEAAAPAAAAEQVSTVEPAVAEQSANATAEAKTAEKIPEQGANIPEDAKKSEIVEKTAEIAIAKSEEQAKEDVTKTDIEMKDPVSDVAPVTEVVPAAPVTTTPAPKARGGRLKSGAGDSKGRGLHKKASKARLTHIDAQPGDHFLVKLKGFPAWPAIVCDESMLPAALINTRPASAARENGSYSEAYATGGKRVQDRSFPVMYLYTNEFGWVQNTALTELTAEKAKGTLNDKMRKDVRAAFELAADYHPVNYYKDILKHFQEEQIAQEQARRDAAATPKKSKKGKGVVTSDDTDLDLDEAEAAPRSTKSKKRKAEEETATPQRSSSVKKPKIKLNTSSTPKTANSVATPKSAAGSAAKSGKAKAKKAKDGGEKKAEAPKEPKMTPEERHARKEKEVLYLRHKLQRGLLTREQQPREDEMNTISEFITVLENFIDLEVSIIRATKINKVLKAILKLESIPREDEFHFKRRSQVLLNKWNKLLASESTPTAAAARTTTNGVADTPADKGTGEAEAEEKKAEDEEAKETTKADANGIQKEAAAATVVEGEKASDSKPDGQASEDHTTEEPVSDEKQQQKAVDKQAAVAVESTTTAE